LSNPVARSDRYAVLSCLGELALPIELAGMFAYPGDDIGI